MGYDLYILVSRCRWVLINPEEENGVHLFVVNQKQEGVICLKLGVEKRSGRAEPKESCCCGCFTPFLVYFNERLVLRTVESYCVGFIISRGIHVNEPGQVGVSPKQFTNVQIGEWFS